MNYQKLDAALATALNNIQDSEKPSLGVFIHTEAILDSNATAVLENLGVSGVSSGKDIFTATLSPNAISQLSEQPWVKYLKRSQQLSLVNKRMNTGKLGVQ
ncbi:hypothetical protein [Nostoc sp. CCY 9925]|uniref:hypothetical protein n=1 Tax=Nostoc sp. CCY 9925 TaxID=3103865 RepID=UPI0039C70462